MITQSNIKNLLNYDPCIGVFRWIVGFRRIKPGEVAGTICDGYVRIKINGKSYLAHRLAFLYMTGNFPNITDHINGIRSDNRFENLRDVSVAINRQNIRTHDADNKCSFLGVTNYKGKFRATIKVNKKTKHLGLFATAKDAHAAYVLAKREYHSGCTI